MSSMLGVRKGLVEAIRGIDELLMDQGVPVPQPIPYIQPVSEVKVEFAAAINKLVAMVYSEVYSDNNITEHRFLECIEAWGKVFREVHDETPVRSEDLVKLALGSRC